jgi:hypothetical protein
MTQLTLFGIPTVLAGVEVTHLIDDISELWLRAYSRPPAGVDEDLMECRRFFDPSLRGFTLRERLAEVEQASYPVYRRMTKIGEPLVVDIGEQRLLVGVEARLTMAVLSDKAVEDEHVVITWRDVLEAEKRALVIYRAWSVGKLNQIIDLRAGAGKEVLQATSVGLIIALLINRSTSPATAYRDRGSSLEGKITDDAVHSAAILFAETIATGRKKSKDQHKFKGGYIISEARRRLAHRLVLDESGGQSERFFYIPEKYQQEVIDFLGRDLARRASLNGDMLKSGLGVLVEAFRSRADDLANHSVIYERPADTSEILAKIMVAFESSRREQEMDAK